MKRKFWLFILSFVMSLGAMAQQWVLTGTAVDGKTKNPVDFASAVLMRTDSTAVMAATTDENGAFKLVGKEAGNYIVKISYVGFKPFTRNVKLTAEQDSIGLGTLAMQSNDRVLGSATVTATASRVEQKGDTTMFSASAYRVPTGSTLEALVKQLPGVEVDDNGGIKWNGKTVQEFLINGKDFFKGDTKTAMKNLPTELVSKIKAYDKKSDYTEQTGIDDGEETTVLDIATKRELNESWVSNLDLGYGSHDRYSTRFFGSRFTDKTRVTTFGSLNNTNDQGFGGPRGFGGGSNGLTASKTVGLDFSWENGKQKREAGRLQLGGFALYSHTSSDAVSTSNSETFLNAGKGSSFANSFSFNGSHRTSVISRFKLEWSPDSMTNINFQPRYNYVESRNSGTSSSATFNQNPYELEGMVSPLDSIFAQVAAERYNTALYGMMVNTNQRMSKGDSKSHAISANLNIVRRLSSNGRNVSLRASGGYTKSENNSYAISDIRYNTVTNPTNTGSNLNQYSTTPGKNYNASVRLGYVEPLGNNWFGEVRYEYSYKYNKSDRSRYNLNELLQQDVDLVGPYNQKFGSLTDYPELGSLPLAYGNLSVNDILNLVRDANNSQYATYKYSNHSATLGVRYNTSAIRFNAGVDFDPEHTTMAYNRPSQLDTVVTRSVFNVSPQVRFRYRFSKTNSLDINYRGSSSQPSMTDLLAVVDDSNPLNISMGNPGLKPSWNNNFRINYNGYNATRQQGIMAGVDGSFTRNSISNRMVYDETTGVRYMRPENINGNWNGRGMFMFNSAMGKEKLFNISTHTSLSYDNAVSYVSSRSSNPTTYAMPYGNLMPLADATAEVEHNYAYYNNIFNSAASASEKNTTRTLGVSENLNLSFRKSWFDVGLIGKLNYQHARATVQDNANMDTWNFAYGANANFIFDFGLSISTDISMSSRRGYVASSMNTNELLWNAQIAQSFLKNKAATVSLQFYDILQKQSNISRVLTATQRTDSWNNAINSYFMVHFIYKLNIFPGGGSSKKNDKDGDRNGDRPGPPDMRGPGGMPMRPAGGGRPGGMPGFRVM